MGLLPARSAPPSTGRDLHLCLRTSSGHWSPRWPAGQGCVRMDAEQPATSVGTPYPSGEMTGVHNHAGCQSPAAECAGAHSSPRADTAPFISCFPFLASLSPGKHTKSCRNCFPGKVITKKSTFPWGFQNSIHQDLRPSSRRGTVPPYFRQGAAFSYLSARDLFLGLQMTPAQNKEKQIEMRILITVKGNERLCQRFHGKRRPSGIHHPSCKNPLYARIWSEQALPSLKISILVKILLGIRTET